jgi:hypothetical protein
VLAIQTLVIFGTVRCCHLALEFDITKFIYHGMSHLRTSCNSAAISKCFDFPDFCHKMSKNPFPLIFRLWITTITLGLNTMRCRLEFLKVR